MAARFTVVLAIAYLLQAVCAAPYIGGGCGCDCGCGGSTISNPVPVNYPQVVARNSGCSSSYITPAVCQPIAYETPVETYSSGYSGPTAESVVTVPGYCPTSCAATRSRCGGTTRSVTQGAATVIPTGSYTTGDLDVIGNTVALNEREVGAPIVSSQVLAPGGVDYVSPGVVEYGYPGAVYGGAGYGAGVVEYGYPGAVYGGAGYAVGAGQYGYPGAAYGGAGYGAGIVECGYPGAVYGGAGYGAGAVYGGAVGVAQYGYPGAGCGGLGCGCGCGCGY